MDASTAMRVPRTMRASPVWAASHPCRRCAGVMPLCSATLRCSGKRCAKRCSSCGVRLISGTSTSTCASGSRDSTCSTARRYTSVLPLPVQPNSSMGGTGCRRAAASIAATAASCWGVSTTDVSGGDGDIVSAMPAFCGPAWRVCLACFLSRRISCVRSRSRNCGGNAASATSPRLRW